MRLEQYRLRSGQAAEIHSPIKQMGQGRQAENPETRNSPGHNRTKNTQWNNAQKWSPRQTKTSQDECVWCAYMEECND